MENSINSNQDPNSQSLDDLIKENLRLTNEVKESVVKIQRWVFWQRIWLVAKVLIVIVPIIIGLMYLPPLLANFYIEYQKLFSGFGIGNMGQVILPETENAGQ